MMRVLGLKYVGKREEGIMVMLFKSYKTVKITKAKPYKFTEKDRVDDEACNYYKKLAKLGLSLIHEDKDLNVKPNHANEVRTEPMAAEVDVQLDPATPITTSDDQLIPDQPVVEDPAAEVIPEETNTTTENDENAEVTEESTPVTSENSAVDKEAIKLMNAAEISEYLEMNFSRDQIKNLITELDLDISIGRKGTPNLIGEIVAATELDNLINYLCK